MSPNSLPPQGIDAAPQDQAPAPAVVTAQAVQAVIDASAYGEYGSDHDWSPSYSLAEKAQFLATMLEQWPQTEPAGHTAILGYARALIAESRRYAQQPAAVLVQHAGRAEVVELVRRQLQSGLFALGLLAAMRAQGVRCEPWLAQIAQNVAERRFNDSKRLVNLGSLYREVQAALAGFAAA